MKLTGTVVAAAAGLGTAGLAAAESYQTVTVGAGKTETRTLGDGDTLENVLFDITADGASLKIRPNGSNWTIRNVGVKGQPHGWKLPNTSYVIGATVTKGGNGLIKNVYIGDGASAQDDVIGIFVTLDHAGTVTIRDCNLQQWPNNGVYGAPPGRSAPTDGGGGGGEVHIERCYARNNNLDGFRIGTNGSYVRDSVVHVDKDVPHAYRNPDAVNARGIWVKEGGYCDIENCDVLLEHPDASYCIWEGDKEEEGLARVSNCELLAQNGANGPFRPNGNYTKNNIGSNPNISIPASVPKTAKEAAENSSGAGGDARGPKHNITFSGGESGDKFQYNFRATNSVKPIRDIGGEDQVGAATANGSTVGGSDGYRFEQDVAEMSVDLGGRITVNVNRSDRIITITGSTTDGFVDYIVGVTGDLRRRSNVENHQLTVDPNGDTASGQVNEASDSWKYTGELDHINLDNGAATVDVLRRHLLRIKDYNDGVNATYDFSVTGKVWKRSLADGNDTVTGNSASGVVANGSDDFLYTGRITAFNHTGAIRTYIDEKEIITPSLGNNTVSLEGPGTSRSYSFDVVGGLGKSSAGDSSINSNDTISNRTASGSVAAGDDSYDYRDGVRFQGANWNKVTHYFFTR